MDIEKLKALHYAVRLVCVQILVRITCTVGIVSNTLNILVLIRPRMRTSTNTYLVALSLCDLLYCISLLALSIRLVGSFEVNWSYMICVPQLLAFGDIWSNCATWITCAFTVERFIAVSSPMLARSICTIARSKRIILAVFLVALSLTVPDWFTRTIGCGVCVSRNQSICIEQSYCTALDQPVCAPEQCWSKFVLRDTEFGLSSSRFGWPVIKTSLVIFIPLVLLTVFNGLLIQSVLQASRKRKMIGSVRQGGLYLKSCPATQFNARQQLSSEGQQAAVCPDFFSGFSRSLTKSGCRTKRDRLMKIAEDRYDGGPVQTESSIPSSTDQSNSIRSQPHSSPSGLRASPRARTGMFGRLAVRARLHERQRITVMLIVVVIVFCVCTLPSGVLFLVSNTTNHRNDKHVQLMLQIAGNFINLLLVINSSLNFFLYSFLNSQFRAQVSALFMCQKF